MKKTPVLGLLSYLFVMVLLAGSVFFCRTVLAEEHAVAAVPDGQAPEPHLVFKKSVVVKKYEEGQAYIEPHIMKKGEYLWKIMREHYKLSNTRIAFYCKIAKKVNPEIEDINVLEPNQNILIPFQYVKDGESAATGEGYLNDTEYVVESGEHLAEILRYRYGIPETVLFSRLTYRLFLEANPDIHDINILEKGQKIVVPAELLAFRHAGLPVAQAAAVVARPAEKPPAQTPSPDPGTLKSQPAVSKKILPKPESVARVPAQPPQKAVVRTVQVPPQPTPEKTQPKPPAELGPVKDMMSYVARSFAGTDNSTGIETIGLAGRGSMTLDYTRFPVYNFPWGKKILIDYGNKLPAGVKQVITSEWDNAEVVAVREREDMESMLDKVFDVAGFHKVEKGGEYIINRDNIQISVHGNWIVFKDQSLKNVFIVNLVQDQDAAISAELESYLSGLGLKMVNIMSDKTKADLRKKKPSIPHEIKRQRIESEPMLLTDTILNLLDIAYKKDYSTNIFQNVYSGFSLEVIADRMFERNGAPFLIDFHDLPDKICTIIADQGINLLKINTQQDTLDAVAQKVLAFCSAPYTPSPATFQYSQGKKSQIKLSVPGFLISSSPNQVLLTQVELKKPIVEFLSEQGVKIVQY